MENIKEDINEFEDLDLTSTTEEQIPQATVSEINNDDMLSNDNSGQSYDWKKAPTTGKAPPRINLDGKEVIIVKADIKLPGFDKPWQPAKNNKTIFYKMCQFTLFFDYEGQQEFLSGMRVFKTVEKGVEKYSHPSITRDRKNQVSQLLGVYADFKKKHINEVSLHEFMSFLNSKPKVRIKATPFSNPETGETVTKNMIGTFL